MEEFDELMPTPDEEGRLDLSHRAWKDVDEVVWTMGSEVVALFLGYNRLSALPNELGDLKLLKELDISCNAIAALPRRIGNLRHLTTFKANGNALSELPDEIGQCLALETLLISENHLITLPRSLGKLRRLKKLQAQNNKLEMLPPTLADVAETLTDINVRNNPHLTAVIPDKICADTPLILWVLKLHRSNELLCKDLIDESDHIKNLIDAAEDRKNLLTAQLHKLNDERLDIIRHTPSNVIERCLALGKRFLHALPHR